MDVGICTLGLCESTMPSWPPESPRLFSLIARILSSPGHFHKLIPAKGLCVLWRLHGASAHLFTAAAPGQLASHTASIFCGPYLWESCWLLTMLPFHFPSLTAQWEQRISRHSPGPGAHRPAPRCSSVQFGKMQNETEIRRETQDGGTR